MAAPHLPLLPGTMMDKPAMRTAMLATRAGADPRSGALLVRHVLPLCPPGCTVAGYWPMGSEIDIRPVLDALHDAGHAVLLPETPPRGQPLLFRRWWPGVAMRRERFGTERPHGPPAEPDMLLVPLLAFDRTCHRLGYGGGYYDRTLAARPGLRGVGCAFACQEVDAVPVLPHDVPLDAIATERGVIFRPES